MGKKVVDIVKKVNQHKHTKACRKYSTNCRFDFPKFPVWKTIIARPNTGVSNKEKDNYAKILHDVREKLLDDEAINRIMNGFKKESESEHEYQQKREERIKQLLSTAGYKSERDFEMYLEALSYSKKGYSIILERDIDEIYVNSYNSEWILAWNGNIDLQICLDFFAVITYITEYFTKDDTGTLEVLVNALKNTDYDSLKDRMKLLKDTFITHRQIGEAEAVYKILPDFHFKESNISTVFLPNQPFEQRNKFLIKVDDKQQYKKYSTVKIFDKEGEYIEKYDIVSK